ncbi:MAG: hypothetical protein MUE73_20935 [Planctomycetes bacterium]|jgi:hypothetical protein|nr:hypothetical protein [Planctomycetota bacterium]
MEPPERPDHARCRNLVHEILPRDGRCVPGRYCVNRLGIIQVLDCPVFQGLSCCLFDPRPADEAPRVVSEDELEVLRERLAADLLRWPYFRRVEVLRGPEAPPEKPMVVPEPEEEEPEPPVPEEEITPTALALPAPDSGETLAEKYPGQRRSEDRFRSRQERRAAAEAEGRDGDEPAGEPEPGPPTEPEPEPEPEPEASSSDPPDPPAPEGAATPGKRRGRRRRRRRGGAARPGEAGPARAGEE